MVVPNTTTTTICITVIFICLGNFLFQILGDLLLQIEGYGSISPEEFHDVLLRWTL